MTLEEILAKWFPNEENFKHEEDTYCAAYGELIDLLNAIGSLTTYIPEANELIEELDSIAEEGAVYDEYGERIHTEDMTDEEYKRFCKEYYNIDVEE